MGLFTTTPASDLIPTSERLSKDKGMSFKYLGFLKNVIMYTI